eukprot:c18532_g1_i2.p1 GENE.c18532_g1_i2~~c18532_g1_i2.p1  ORF type:complete len:300 (+),score=42.78 c18532_g1_i2:50-949(+)
MLISQPMEARSQRDQFDTPTIHNIPEERPKHPMVLALMISVSSVCILALIATFSASENFSDNASVAANNPIRDLELDFKGDKQQPTDSLTCGSSIIGAQFSSARYAVYRIDFSGDRMKFGFRSCVAGNAPTLSVMGGLFGPVVASFGPNRDCLTEVFVDLDPGSYLVFIAGGSSSSYDIFVSCELRCGKTFSGITPSNAVYNTGRTTGIASFYVQWSGWTVSACDPTLFASSLAINSVLDNVNDVADTGSCRYSFRRPVPFIISIIAPNSDARGRWFKIQMTSCPASYTGGDPRNPLLG